MVRLYFLLLTLCVLHQGYSQGLTIELSQDTVGINQPFDIIYKLEKQCNEEPALDPKHISILGGPMISSSYSWINGKSEASYSIGYKLKGNTAGTYVFPLSLCDEISKDSIQIVIHGTDLIEPKVAPVKSIKKRKIKKI